MPLLHVAREGRARIRQDCDLVVLEIDGKVVRLTWDAALELGRALRDKGKRAEAWAKRDATADDLAILVRAGANIGLSDDPDVKSEAVKRARDDRDLRRYMPGGIKSQAVFGRPTIYHAEKKGDDANG